MTEDELSNKVIGCALQVHRQVGAGLLESVYRECLFYELTEAGLFVEKEKLIPLKYKTIHLNIAFRLDFLVERRLIIELKCVEAFTDAHIAQVLTYLHLTGCHLGIILNFHKPLLKDGIRRVVL